MINVLFEFTTLNFRIPTLRQAGSDFFAFLQGVGVPCIDLFYVSQFNFDITLLCLLLNHI